MYRSIVIISLLLTWIVHTTVAAQDTLAPSVGVVLSGGGAKGLAHVGVLQVLEEYQVTVDAIGGTSMGAIIGGFYAAGYSADQLDSIIHSHDMSEIILGELPRSSAGIRQKRYDEKATLTLTYDKGKVDIPAGFSDGQHIYDFLYLNTYPMNRQRDFSQLSRPFYCIATDLSTGEEVLLEDGNLAMAMRASSSLPTIINPVAVDSQLFIDGGVVNNLPAKEMRDRGIDIVVCVSVEDGLSSNEELLSATDILGQVTSYSIVQKSEEQYEYCDLLIRPDIEGVGLLDFDLVDTLVLRGKEAALSHQDALVKIGTAQQEVRPYRHQQVSSHRRYLELDRIIIDADSETKTYLQNILPWEEGTYIELQDIGSGIDQVKASGYFDNIYYDIQPVSDVAIQLRLTPTLKRHYDNTFGTGFHFDNFYGGGLLLQTKMRSLLRRGDYLQADLVIGNRIRYDLSYLLNGGGVNNVGLRSAYEYNSVNTKLQEPLSIDSSLSIDEVIFEYQNFYNELNITTYSRSNTLVELAAGMHYYKVESDQLETTAMRNLAIDDTWYLSTEARYYFDDLNDRQFSMQGRRLALTAKGLYPLTSNVTPAAEGLGLNLDIDLMQYVPLRDRLSIGLELRGGLNLIEVHAPMVYNFATANQNLINRLKPFPGLAPGEASGRSALLVSPFARYRFYDNIFLTGHLRALFVGDSTNPLLAGDKSVFGGSLGIGYRTLLGPMEIIYGHAKDEGEIYINLGYWF